MSAAEDAAIAVLEVLPNLPHGWVVRTIPQWYLCFRCFHMIEADERHLWHSASWLAFHTQCAVKLGFERGALTELPDTSAGVS